MVRKRSKSKGQSADLRRVPSQERSRRRLDGILDAAARLFASEGFAATTMERIAAGAGTSIGSVYQFFPNKRAVFKAVALECIRLSEAAFARHVDLELMKGPWTDLLDAAVDTFVSLEESNPIFRAVWRNLQLYDDYAAEDEAQMRDFSERTAQLLGSWIPGMSLEQRRNVATTLLNAIVALLFVGSRGGGPIDPGLIQETKRLLRRYLRPYVESGAS